MKKLLCFIISCILVLSMAGCGKNNPEYRAFITHDGEDYQEFMVILYDKETHALLEMRDVTHFNKDFGYTWYDVSNIDVDSVYPGFSELSFGETEMKDEDSFISFTVRFKELDVNYRQAVEIGLVNSGENLDRIDCFNADSLCDSIPARELSKEECAEYKIKI